MLAAIGDAKTCPHGHPIEVGARDRGRAAGRRRGRARRVTVLRFENEAEDLLHYLKDSGLEPGLDGHARRRRRRGTSSSRRRPRCTVDPRVAETVSVLADPSPPPRVALPEQLVLARTATAAGRRRGTATAASGHARACVLAAGRSSARSATTSVRAAIGARRAVSSDDRGSATIA